MIDAALEDQKGYINQEKTRVEINKMAPLVAIHDNLTAVLQVPTDLLQNITDLN
jgi:hypothetical protein